MEGGFVVRFEGAKEKTKPKTCYAVTLDYDEWSYTLNNEPAQGIPLGTKRIIIEVEIK